MADIEECERDEEGNYLDILTYNVIPIDRLIRVPMGVTAKCFDIDSLYRLYVESGQIVNPFTREPLPKSIIQEIKRYGIEREEVFRISLTLNSSRSTELLAMPYYKKIGDLIIKIISTSAEQSGTSYVTFLRYDLVDQDGNSIYLMNLEADVSSLVKRSVHYKDYQRIEARREALNQLIDYLKLNSGPEMSTNYIMHQAALQVVQSNSFYSYHGTSLHEGMSSFSVGMEELYQILHPPMMRRAFHQNMPQAVARFPSSYTTMNADFDGDMVEVIYNPAVSNLDADDSTDDSMPPLEETRNFSH